MYKIVKFNVTPDIAAALCAEEYSTLTDKNVEILESWSYNIEKGKFGAWFIEDAENFGKCEVTGLLSNLMQVSWNYKD